MLILLILFLFMIRGSYELLRIMFKAVVFFVVFAVICGLIGSVFGLIGGAFSMAVNLVSSVIRSVGIIPLAILFVIFLDWMGRKKREGQIS